ncbi:DUF6710 family protein [Rahnella sp. ChDrAdgB13]|uniref:DUF6710 family protein n=1 Tax=Rahnella sp. ChDrAdgB13 TaxID=1850581 RepID=UPI001AD8910D|nr:DUF6710 family protein [Rahnella sp. ChDrAdgB13]
MMFWNQNKKGEPAASSEKNRFDHLLSVAEKLPVAALPDLLRAIVRPVQSDLLLAVAEEGADSRPDMTPQEFFFDGLIQVQSYEKMKEGELDSADYPLSLASDIVLPWPWSLSRYIDNLSYIGTHKGSPWKQDKINHYVDLWLPWRIGFVRGGNHSITAGILAGEGTVIPDHVYDMSYMFELVRADGVHWFVDGQKTEAVKSGRSAAVFEIGRLIAEGENNG